MTDLDAQVDENIHTGNKGPSERPSLDAVTERMIADPGVAHTLIPLSATAQRFARRRRSGPFNAESRRPRVGGVGW